MNTPNITRRKQTDPRCRPMWDGLRRCITCTFYMRLDAEDASGLCAYYRNDPHRMLYVAGEGAACQEYAAHFISYSEG